MNNPFKLIFLIINLLPSVAPNNYSQPLSETELQMAQNVSEFTKREEPIYLHSGFGITGFTFSKKIPGLTSQRPCTLGFPVVKYDKYFGFLTSYACASNNIFVEETEVGKVGAPGAFIPEKGLDYTYVLVYSSYWSEEVSRKITYPNCDSGGRGMEMFIPLLPTPHQFRPSHLGAEVCTYGGASGYVCGEIVKFDDTIKVRSPIDEEDYQFSGVTKVKMNKPYSRGDLGAPVYISDQVPNSKQMIASPVGQVIEVVGEKEQNIWYYIPLNRILEESELEIASGDLSSLLPPELNDIESNNVSLSNNLTMSSNTSDANLVRRQQRILLTHGGFPVQMSIQEHNYIPDTAKRCTLGFAIRKPEGRGQFEHGFLTLGTCLQRRVWNDRDGVFAFFVSLHNPGEIEPVQVGTVSDLWYDPDIGMNYAVVRLRPNDDGNLFWEDISSTMIPVPGPRGVFASVNGPQYVPRMGEQVCWEGGASSHGCGTVTSLTGRISIINLWEWQRILREAFDIDLFDDFYDLIEARVDVGVGGVPRDNIFDRGSPVYFPIRGNNNQINRVRPVGLLFEFRSRYENVGDRCQNVYYMYCISIDRILNVNHRLRLISTPPLPQPPQQ